MQLEAYTRALAGARDAVAATYAERVGAPMADDDLALSLAMAAVSAFLDAAKGEPVIGAHVEVFRPDIGKPEMMNEGANATARVRGHTAESAMRGTIR